MSTAAFSIRNDYIHSTFNGIIRTGILLDVNERLLVRHVQAMHMMIIRDTGNWWWITPYATTFLNSNIGPFPNPESALAALTLLKD